MLRVLERADGIGRLQGSADRIEAADQHVLAMRVDIE
jgi:hypothetical protein